MRTLDEIQAALSRFVCPKDRVILVHSSISAFYPERLEPKKVLACLMEFTGPDTTLVMPTFSFSVYSSKNYHYSKTPSDVGDLSNFFLKYPGVIRSENPLCSFSAVGPLAKALMQDEGKTNWGKDTPFERLYLCNAVVVGLGVRLGKAGSILHYAEEAAGVPYRYYKTFEGMADYGNGKTGFSKKTFVRRMDLPADYDFQEVINRVSEKGNFLRQKAGNSFIEITRAKDITDTCINLLKEDPLCLLSDKYEYKEASAKPLFTFLSSTNTDYLAKYLKANYKDFTGRKECRILNIPFDQYRQHLLNDESDLLVQQPDYSVFVETVENVFGELVEDPISFSSLSSAERESLVQDRLDEYIKIITLARKNLKKTIIITGLFPLEPSPLRLADFSYAGGISKIIQTANEKLCQLQGELEDAYYIPIEAISRFSGLYGEGEKKYWYLGRIPFGRKFSIELCKKIIGISLYLQGRTCRVLVLDLDNTLWEGVIGDDGMEGVQLGGDYPGNVFKSFQQFLRNLRKTGIILTICSKNTKKVALEMIEKHPDMVLRPKEITAMRINWRPKSENILSLSEELNIGLKNFCVIDDNPVERKLIKETLSDVYVPDLPPDPSDWIDYLSGDPFLEFCRLTDSDLKRSSEYSVRKKRLEVQKMFQDMDDFYRSLGIKISIDPMIKETSNRTLQLINKTNQFNATTRRYSQNDLRDLMQKKGARVFTVSYADKFSSREVIGVIILVDTQYNGSKATEIDTFLLSCRVLGRKLDTVCLGWISRYLKRKSKRIILGKIIPTERNLPVRGIYLDNGFEQVQENIFVYDLKGGSIAIPAGFEVT